MVTQYNVQGNYYCSFIRPAEVAEDDPTAMLDIIKGLEKTYVATGYQGRFVTPSIVTGNIFNWGDTFYREEKLSKTFVRSDFPSIESDSSKGFNAGDIWINTQSKLSYLAVTVDVGDAEWILWNTKSTSEILWEVSGDSVEGDYELAHLALDFSNFTSFTFSSEDSTSTVSKTYTEFSSGSSFKLFGPGVSVKVQNAVYEKGGYVVSPAVYETQYNDHITITYVNDTTFNLSEVTNWNLNKIIGTF